MKRNGTANRDREKRERFARLLLRSFEKSYSGRFHLSRGGLLVTLMVLLLCFSANVIAMKFWEDARDQYMAVRIASDGYRARMLATGGFHAGIKALQHLPEEVLYRYDLSMNPPDIAVEQCGRTCEKCPPECFFTYRLRPEDGKLNLNNLVLHETDEPNRQFMGIFERFFRAYNIENPDALVDSLVDWIDENSNTEGRGGEGDNHYAQLVPPIKIKNYRLFSLSEIARVKGFSFKMIYTSQAPPDWEEIKKNQKFQGEDEEIVLQDPDWIPANNLTAYIPISGNPGSKININAVRYHALLGLSNGMSREAIRALFKLRRNSNNYIKDLSVLKKLPEFQVKQGELTLYEELVGTGGKLSGLLKTKGEIYRVVGVGTVIITDDNNKQRPVVRRISGLWDVLNKRLIYYSED